MIPSYDVNNVERKNTPGEALMVLPLEILFEVLKAT
jgi:hypothetical protein